MTTTLIPLPLALFSLGPGEMIILGGLALLLFGKRLPEVGRGAGQAITQFKRGLKEVETEIEEASKQSDVRKAIDDADRPTVDAEKPREPATTTSA